MTTINETIFIDGASYFDALIQDIRNAKVSIDLETYIFTHDKTGQQVTDALKEAAKRGVAVRLLIDGAGSFISWHDAVHQDLLKHQIQVRIFHPFPWHPQPNDDSPPLGLPDRTIHMLLNCNRRNHRKTCVIDSAIAYAGSMNISHCHIGIKPELGWRDTAVRFSGTHLMPLINAFNHAWEQTRFYQFSKKKEQEKPSLDPVIRLNASWHNRRLMAKSLHQQIDQAKKRIWITSAYFVPDKITLRRLIQAAKRGVDIKILLPQKSDIFYMPWISASFYPLLLKHGVEIYEYHPKMLHAKTIIADNWIIVGSSNMNHRSLLHDLEVDICLQTTASKKVIIEQFNEDMRLSHMIDQDSLYRKPLYKRAIGFILSHFRHWV